MSVQRPVQNSAPQAAVSWANRPSAGSVAPGAVFRIVDTWTPPQGLLFTSNGTHWVPLNGQCLLYEWDLSALSTTATTLTAVSGFTSPTFPWADLMAVPGFVLEASVFASRVSAANTQSCRIDVYPGSESSKQFIVYIPAASTSGEVRGWGRAAWSRTGFMRRAISIGGTIGGEYASLLSGQAANEVATPANGAVALSANTGGAGETMNFHSLQLRYFAQ